MMCLIIRLNRYQMCQGAKMRHCAKFEYLGQNHHDALPNPFHLCMLPTAASALGGLVY